MDSTVLVRLQLEALSRCVDEVYRTAPGTKYAAGLEGQRDARVDIDLAGGRLLVVYQERAPSGEVLMEQDDTAAALEALQVSEVGAAVEWQFMEHQAVPGTPSRALACPSTSVTRAPSRRRRRVVVVFGP